MFENANERHHLVSYRIYKSCLFQWPACSPDQNPIENIWGIIVRSVYAENRHFDSIEELKVAIIKAWNEITPSTRKKLIDSMPNRIFELIKNKGGSTKY
jgi:transposase